MSRCRSVPKSSFSGGSGRIDFIKIVVAIFRPAYIDLPFSVARKSKVMLAHIMCETRDAENPHNRIVRTDEKGKVWLRDNNLWPSDWGLPPEELEFIRSARIVLNFLFSPSAVVDFPPPDFVGNEPVPFIFVDATLVQDRHVMLSREELISIILHEIGHKINRITTEERLQGQRVTNEEDLADDYAWCFGFGEHLARGLEKLRDSGRAFFLPDEINRRIQRIRNPENHYLCQRLRQLNGCATGELNINLNNEQRDGMR